MCICADEIVYLYMLNYLSQHVLIHGFLDESDFSGLHRNIVSGK
jgi:hypothetical protein